MAMESMTGYGRGVAGNTVVEIRSTNHKSLDIHLSIPQFLYSQEPEIRKRIKNQIQRGRIEVYVPRNTGNGGILRVNKKLASDYYNAFVELKQELSLEGEIDLRVLAMQKDIFSVDDPEVDEGEFYSALDAAISELRQSRLAEGENISRDIKARIENLIERVKIIENKRTEFIKNARQRLSERIKELIGDMAVDEARLIQEVAFLIDKSDITEEIVRIYSHIDQLKNIIDSPEAAGKKIDFLLQELRREVNTIGAKAQDVEIIHSVVEIKHEIEKIREQVQNIQ